MHRNFGLTQNISNNVATGYDTFYQADENGKGLFAGCHYDKTDDLLDVPAYYYLKSATSFVAV